MLKNYLKVALRSLLRQKAYSFINIFGLAVGLACCILIFLFVQHEWSFDAFHQNAGKIFRVIQDEKNAGGERTLSAYQPLPLAPALREEFPAITRAVRFIPSSNVIVKHGEASFSENVLFADSPMFEMFSFQLLQGDPATALQNPNAIVLSEKMAQKYFHNAEPLGQRLALNFGNQFEDFVVTGVAQNAPENSSIRFDFVLPYIKYPAYESALKRWNSNRTSTFIQLADMHEATALENQFPPFVEKYFGALIQAAQSDGQLTKDADAFQLRLQALTDIHLNPNFANSIEPASNPVYSYILAGIAVLVLLIACFNFMILAVGRSTSRAKEVGIRKVVGAGRVQLLRQFFGEALLLSFIALLLGIGMAELFLPEFNQLAGKNLAITYGGNWAFLLAMLALMLLVGLAAGSYPAIFLSHFQPVAVLKDKINFGGGNRLTHALVVIQYALSIFLIAGTLVMMKQMDFLKSQKLGYNEENVVAIRTFTGWNNEGARRLEVFRNALAGRSEIKNVAGTIYSFTRGWSEEGFKSEGVERSAYVYRVDENYLATLGMELIAGRNFSKVFPADSSNAVIVNEALTKDFGWDDAIGRKITGFRNVQGLEEPTVIGVVKNFHFLSLHNEIAPVILHVNPNWPIRYILVKIANAEMPQTLALLRDTWHRISPNAPFEFYFLDEDVENQYRAEMRWGKIVGYASILAIFIACLGLFGLATLTAAKRIKEIGIRKVLGASVAGLAGLLSKDFVKLVLLANLVAWPIAWYAMNKWLQNFAYRTDINWWVFALAGGLAMLIALLTVSTQAIKAALANPVDSLRYE
ncbi:ABC transporter permease [candidate division KSB1 bacterium]|nr:ABC transporter permease [candidate division KSB1 bacterium]